jgi:predicted Zn finger-like uncharacterized protein
MVGMVQRKSSMAFAVSLHWAPSQCHDGSFCVPARALSPSRRSGVSLPVATGAARMLSAMTTMPPSRSRPLDSTSQPRSRGEGRLPRSRNSDERGSQTYTECGKCGAAYEITVADLGDTGKKVVCAVCEHAWFQRADSLRFLNEGATFQDYPLTEKDERIAAKQARRDARGPRTDGPGGGRPERYQRDRGSTGGQGGSEGRFDRRESSGRGEARDGARTFEPRDGGRTSRTADRSSFGQQDGQGDRRVSRYGREFGQENRARPGSRAGGGSSQRAGNGDHTLFIGNLPFSITTESLEKLLRETAEVERVSLVTDPMGRSKGFAFADMKSENDVSTAVAKLNGHDMDGRSLTVRIGKKRES